MTRREAAIVSAYTGYLLGGFGALHAYAEERLGRPVWNHEFAGHEFATELRDLAAADFRAIAVTS